MKLLENKSELFVSKIGELIIDLGTSAFSKFGCKNEGFVTAMVCKGAELHRDAFKLTDTGACFADGSSFECDAVVACSVCTPSLRRRTERLRARVSGDYSRVSFGTLVIVVI